jgi:hypothetical protein
MATAKEIAARNQLIADYVSAFGQANPGKKKPTLRYEAGWFIMDYALTEQRYRKSQIEGMRDRLLARAAGGPEQK